jgi:hypothetical protein
VTDPILALRAFGMDVRSDFPMPGIEPTAHAGDGRSLSLRLGTRAEIESGFPRDSERIGELRFDDGRLAVSVEAGGPAGYLAYAYDFGHARISADGREIVAAPLDKPAWIWQRYLTGQLMPLAGLLQGLEVFHSSVLGLDGRAIAVVANSGVGKTTLALRLALRGLDFVSDDVLVAERDNGGLVAHPGIGLANVRPGARELLPPLEESGMAESIGSNERETRIAVRRAGGALPLSALFVLNRFLDPRELRVERLSPVDPRVLLAATFNVSVRTPDRLARQLDVCSHLERSVSVYRVSWGGEVGGDEVAGAILEQARQPLPC